MTRTEELELEAIRYARVPEMPEALNEDTPVWIDGIAKLTMNTLGTGYAIVRNQYNGTPRYLKVFGNGSVASVVSIHPYKFLDKKYIPQFSGEPAIRTFVAEMYGVSKADVKQLSHEGLLAMVYNYCAKKQLAAEAAPVKRTEQEVEPKEEE